MKAVGCSIIVSSSQINCHIKKYKKYEFSSSHLAHPLPTRLFKIPHKSTTFVAQKINLNYEENNRFACTYFKLIAGPCR